MKKLLVICLMMSMVLCMSVTAFAAPGKFINSPSGNSAPTIVDFDPEDDNCHAKLAITSYSEKKNLSNDKKSLIEKAYDDIVKSDNLANLNEDLKKIVEDKKIKGKDLAVSDLFDLSLFDCDLSDDHTSYIITLSADTLKNFVGFMYMNEDGEWVIVDDAKVTDDGEHLKFTTDSFSPFAIVVNTAASGGDTPQTGDDSMLHLLAMIMAVCAVAIVVIAVKFKKQRA